MFYFKVERSKFSRPNSGDFCVLRHIDFSSFVLKPNLRKFPFLMFNKKTSDKLGLEDQIIGYRGLQKAMH